MHRSALYVLLILASPAVVAAAPTWDEEIAVLPRDFDAAISAEPGDAQDKALNDILVRANALQTRYPERGLAHAWVGWTQFQLAAVATDFSNRIPLIRGALANQEAAVALEPLCCGAEIYVSLAGLYQAPALGKKSESVRAAYDKALEIAPNHLIARTRYAEYLMRMGDYENALKHANAALTAPTLDYSRTGQDKALRETARDLIDQINDRIKRSQTANAAK